jgi:hypothetical protein
VLCRLHPEGAEHFVRQWAATRDSDGVAVKDWFARATPNADSAAALSFVNLYPYVANGRFLQDLMDNPDPWQDLPADQLLGFVREKASEVCLGLIGNFAIQGQSLFEGLRSCAMGEGGAGQDPTLDFLRTGVFGELTTSLMRRVHAEAGVPMVFSATQTVSPALLPDPKTRRMLEDTIIARFPDEWTVLKARARLASTMVGEGGVLMQALALIKIQHELTDLWMEQLEARPEGLDGACETNTAYWAGESAHRRSFLQNAARVKFAPVIDASAAGTRAVRQRRQAAPGLPPSVLRAPP